MKKKKRISLEVNSSSHDWYIYLHLDIELYDGFQYTNLDSVQINFISWLVCLYETLRYISAYITFFFSFHFISRDRGVAPAAVDFT